MQNHISRRALAAGIALAPVAGLPALASDCDAELVRLGAELGVAWKAERVAEGKAGDAEFQAACDVTSDVVERILNVQSRSIAGLCVKARALSWCHSGKFEGFLPEPGVQEAVERTTDMRLIDSICRDLLAISGEA